MIRIHGTGLAAIIPGLVGVLVIHVIGYSNFREKHRVISHVVQALIPKKFELVAQAVPDGSLANFHRKGWGKILASKDPNDIHIVESIPTNINTRLNGGVNNTHQCFVKRVSPS